MASISAHPDAECQDPRKSVVQPIQTYSGIHIQSLNRPFRCGPRIPRRSFRNPAGRLGVEQIALAWPGLRALVVQPESSGWRRNCRLRRSKVPVGLIPTIEIPEFVRVISFRSNARRAATISLTLKRRAMKSCVSAPGFLPGSLHEIRRHEKFGCRPITQLFSRVICRLHSP